jgi:chemotaxis protein MotB
MTGAVQFQVDKRGLIIRVWTNAVIFGGNSATLLDGGKNVLNVIAPELKNDPHNIEVDGYTNQLPSGTGPFASGWELSGDRAAAVVRYLIGRGVSYTKHHMRATGMNDQNPLLPPSDPRSVSRNRRVEIVVLTSLSTTQAAELPAADRQTTTH